MSAPYPVAKNSDDLSAIPFPLNLSSDAVPPARKRQRIRPLIFLRGAQVASLFIHHRHRALTAQRNIAATSIATRLHLINFPSSGIRPNESYRDRRKRGHSTTYSERTEPAIPQDAGKSAPNQWVSWFSAAQSMGVLFPFFQPAAA